MNIQDRMAKAATIENAKKHLYEQEKFVFCLTVLGEISANHPMADEWVDSLEAQFDKLLVIDRLEQDRKAAKHCLEISKKRHGQNMILDAENEIESIDCLIGNAREEIKEIRAAL